MALEDGESFLEANGDLIWLARSINERSKKAQHLQHVYTGTGKQVLNCDHSSVTAHLDFRSPRLKLDFPDKILQNILQRKANMIQRCLT